MLWWEDEQNRHLRHCSLLRCLLLWGLCVGSVSSFALLLRDSLGIARRRRDASMLILEAR